MSAVSDPVEDLGNLWRWFGERSTRHYSPIYTEICLAVGLSSLGSFMSSFGRVYGTTPLGYRSSFPPARRHIRIPNCVAQAYGRRENRTFGEASSSTAPYR